MGGLGFLILFVGWILRVVGAIGEARENLEGRQKYAHPNGLTYIDSRGCSRLMSNNRKVMYQDYHGFPVEWKALGVKEGDRIIVDVEKYELVMNLGNEEERKLAEYKKKMEEEEAEELKRRFSGKSVYCLSSEVIFEDGVLKGLRVIDRQTGKTYACCHGGYSDDRIFYCDPETWLIVKVGGRFPADPRSKHRWRPPELSIEELNQRILEHKEKGEQYLYQCVKSYSEYME